MENRSRFPLVVVRAVADAVGRERVGIRIAPQTHFADIDDSAPAETFGYFVDRLSELGLAYMHVIEGETGGSRELPGVDYGDLRRRYAGVYVANNGYDRTLALESIEAGRVDAVAFGVPFIANPDLVERFRVGASLNTVDRNLFYGGDERGYVDYPFLETADANAP